MPNKEIEALTKCFVQSLSPVRIYLFGSYADNTYTEESDYDFYIVVEDNVSDLAGETVKAYKSIRHIKKKPVDILIGTCSRFDSRRDGMTVENEVYRKGILLYEARDKRVT